MGEECIAVVTVFGFPDKDDAPPERKEVGIF
jgi:hypothetical protein